MAPRSSIDRVLAEADGYIIERMNRHLLPGVAAGVVHDGRLVYAKGFGVADAAGGRAVTADSVFRIASISKTMTAIGLMQLWEGGRFALDDPVRDYLRSYRFEHRDPSAPPATFRHFLTHTSGVGEFRTLRDLFNIRRLWALGAGEGEPVPSLAEYYHGWLRPELPPGEKWAYANHAFATLGQVVEDVSGQPFDRYMRERLFAPLGMETTSYVPDDDLRGRLAQGFTFKKGRAKPAPFMEVVGRPAGSVYSSVNEMARYLAALTSGGGNEHGAVLKPETLAMMMEPQYVVDPRLAGAMGLAFFLDRFGGHRIASHNGGWNGYSSAMYLAPDERLGVIMFTNVSTLALDGMATGLLRRLLNVPEPSPEGLTARIPEASHLWPELCGYYGPRPGFMTNARVWMAFGGEVEIFVSGNHLAARGAAGPLRRGVALRRTDPADPLLYQAVYDGMVIPVAFARDGSGRVDRLSAAGVMGFYNWHRRPALQSISVLGRGALGAAGAALLLAAAKRRRGRRCQA